MKLPEIKDESPKKRKVIGRFSCLLRRTSIRKLIYVWFFSYFSIHPLLLLGLSKVVGVLVPKCQSTESKLEQNWYVISINEFFPWL